MKKDYYKIMENRKNIGDSGKRDISIQAEKYVEISKIINPGAEELREQITVLKGKIDILERAMVNTEGAEERSRGVVTKLLSKLPSVFDIKGKVDVDFPVVQKIKGKVDIDFPKTQKVEGKVDVEFPNTQKVEVAGLIKGEMTNMPTAEGREASAKADPTKYMIVRMSNGRQFIDNESQAHTMAGGSTTYAGEKVWLREEYTHTTISGVQVPTKIVKWDDNVKLTEDYAYDADANPITKSRLLEPSTGVGV